MKKTFIAVLTSFALVCSIGLAACGDKTPQDTDKEDPPVEKTEAHVHTWMEDSAKAKSATCGEAARTYYTCSECGSTKTERGTAATGAHEYGDDNICDICGYMDMSGMEEEEAIQEYGYYLLEDADKSNTYSTGDIVLYGSYPTTLVNKGDLKIADGAHVETGDITEDDEELIEALTELQGTLPTASSNGDWDSYGYYDAGEVSDYMFYKDVELDGKKYRGVYLNAYRAYYARLETGEDYSYIDDEGFQLGTVYWFEYAPIRWAVLDYIDGNLFLNSLECLEAQPFQNLRDYDESSSTAYVPGTKTYMNNWETSSLRTFLNNTFFNDAFSAAEQALIQSVTLENKYTGCASDNEYQINQNNTTDKVFLLSWEDLYNTDYGFTSIIDFDDTVTKDRVDADDDSLEEGKGRRRGFTDYTTIQGLHRSTTGHTKNGDGACHYLIRSAGIVSYGICGVTKYGSLWSSGKLSISGTESYDTYAGNGNLGVTPSLYIKVGK